MSLRTLPILIINLGGEMIYILDQRLRSQNETADKTQKGVWSDDDRKRVLNDIVGTMFSKPFMEELMKPGGLYSHRALESVLSRLAHCSVLKLRQDSMDRLYDLMTMAFKYQVLLCPRPRDLLLITFNHIDAVRELIKANPHVVNQINEAQRQLKQMYMPLSDGELQLLRQTLLALLQDTNIKVSIFLQENVQKEDGHFVLATSGPVPDGTEIPGLIRWFSSGREVMRKTFQSGGSYTSSVREGSFDTAGDRVTHLGTNMYGASLKDTSISGVSSDSSKSRQIRTDPNPLAKEELNLLARLVQGVELWSDGQGTELRSGGQTAPVVRLNVLEEEEEEEEEGRGISAQEDQQVFDIINIQATKDEANSELSRIAAEFTEQQQTSASPDKDGDLLAMMDELERRASGPQ